jgi:hypothetical protein
MKVDILGGGGARRRCTRGLARAQRMGGSIARPRRDALDAQPRSAHRRQQGRRDFAVERSPGLRVTQRHQDFRRDTAIKYAESLGYKGMYTIEMNDDAAVRIIYNAIVANLA